MQNDLISRSKLLEEFAKYEEKVAGGNVYYDLVEIIEEQPTAYDLEKVVEQLEEEKDEYERLERGSNYEGYNLEVIKYSAKVEAFREAIEIVQNGGKE